MENTSKHHKYYTLLALIYISLLFVTLIVENRIVYIHGIAISSGTLVLPLSYALGDAIAEVYGYKMSRQLIWYTIISLILSTFFISLIMKIEAKPEYNDYKQVLYNMPRDVFAYSLGTLMGSFLNIFIITKWKIILKGKYFWIRSLASTLIGEALFIITMGSFAFIGVFPLKTVAQLMLASYMIKICYNMIAIFPTSILVIILKKVETIDVYDYKTNFNPFSLKI